jgi:hypothetical protein
MQLVNILLLIVKRDDHTDFGWLAGVRERLGHGEVTPEIAIVTQARAHRFASIGVYPILKEWLR